MGTIVLLVAGIALPAVAAACGSGSDARSPASSIRGAAVDRAVAADLLRHGMAAAAAAEKAQDRVGDDYVAATARGVGRNLAARIAVARAEQRRLEASGVARGEHPGTGSAGDAVISADGFPSGGSGGRWFMAQVHAHLLVSVDAARAEAERGQNPRLRRLARTIAREDEMLAFDVAGWLEGN